MHGMGVNTMIGRASRANRDVGATAIGWVKGEFALQWLQLTSVWPRQQSITCRQAHHDLDSLATAASSSATRASRPDAYAVVCSIVASQQCGSTCQAPSTYRSGIWRAARVGSTKASLQR